MKTIDRSTTRHSLGWLAAGNLVGVLLSALVVWPGLNDLLDPFTYGRWMPLHLDWQLYGWCALPLLGLLCVWFFDVGGLPHSHFANLGLRAWSFALGLGAISWLGGNSSGKLFLEWTGWIRPALPIAMLIAWGVLAVALFLGWPLRQPIHNVGRIALLTLLLPVPFVLYHAVSPKIFPAVNPDSGGATGTTLLGSVLGILAIGALLPWLLKLPVVVRFRIHGLCLIWFLVSTALFVWADHGSVSHHRLSQVLVLASVLVWAVLAPAYFTSFAWPIAARRWLRWAGVWWTLLLFTGWLSFLPGVSERIKFTHVFVGHGHLAMAGLVTSMYGALLTVLDRPFTTTKLLTIWQLAGLVHILTLTAIGGTEVYSPSEFFLNSPLVQSLFGLRLVAGVGMAVPSMIWFWRSWR